MCEDELMNIMIAFGIASIMMLIGTFLRAKVGFLQKLLVPASIIAGVLGLAFVNLCDAFHIDIGATSGDFSSIVNQLFVVSFISITLMGHSEEDSSGGTKSMLKGALAIGLIWCMLFTLTPLVAALISMVCENTFQFDPIYGMLIPFGFCMGPGQSVTYGTIIEGYGWNDAVMAALTFASLGLLAAYLVGIPAAKRAIRRGLAKHSDKIDEEEILRGDPEKARTGGNDEKEYHLQQQYRISGVSLRCHRALLYHSHRNFRKFWRCCRGISETSMSSLMFLNGMYAAWIVKFFMEKI